MVGFNFYKSLGFFFYKFIFGKQLNSTVHHTALAKMCLIPGV